MIIVASVIHSGCVLLVWFLLAVVDRGGLLRLAGGFEIEETYEGLFKAFRMAQSIWWAIIILSLFINFFSISLFLEHFMNLYSYVIKGIKGTK